MLCQKIEKVPLRHERYKLCVRRQVSQVPHPNLALADLRRNALDLLIGPLQKIFQQAKLIQHLES